MATSDGVSKRDAILQAALELFNDRGFDGTVIPMIAERAGVGTGTIYRYFASKEELVNTLFQEWKGRFNRALSEGYRTEASAFAHFQFLWTRMAEFALQNPVAFTFLETHHHAPYLNETSYAVMAESARFVRAFLEDTAKQQITKPLPADALMAMVLGAFVGLFKAFQAGEIQLTPQLIEVAGQCCWECIRQ